MGSGNERINYRSPTKMSYCLISTQLKHVTYPWPIRQLCLQVQDATFDLKGHRQSRASHDYIPFKLWWYCCLLLVLRLA